MSLHVYIFGLLILFAIIFLPLLFKQYSHLEKKEKSPFSRIDTGLSAAQYPLNKGTESRSNSVAWLHDASTIKVTATLHLIFATEHGAATESDYDVTAYHPKNGLIYGYCHCYATESTLYINSITSAIDIARNEDITDRLRSFLRINRAKNHSAH